MLGPAFYWGLLFIASLFVVWKGGPPERLGLVILIIGSVATFVAGTLEGQEFKSFEVSVFLVDVAVLLAFLWLAIRADRFWPMGVAALQLVGLASHAAELASSRIIAWVYSIGQALWSYPIILLIVWGTVRHQRRLARHGADASWTPSLRTAGRIAPGNGPAG